MPWLADKPAMTALPKLYERIADTLAQRIVAGRFMPGTRLPTERELAEEFAVSRPTIREAMIALKLRGMVAARQGSGIYVTDAAATPAAELDVGAFELVEARILFEGEAAALAATVIDAAALDALRALLAAMGAATDQAAKVAIDRRFHLAIAAASGNSLVRSTVEMLWDVRDRSPLCVHMFGRARHEGVEPRLDEHRRIVDALAAHDAAAARAAMRAHLRRVTEDLLAATRLERYDREDTDVAAKSRRLRAQFAD